MSEELLERVFARLVEVALRNERAPTNEQLGGHQSIAQLARRGWIKIEVYALNWRVVELTRGEHAGRRTMGRNSNQSPWLVIDKDGKHMKSLGPLMLQARDGSSELEREMQGKRLPSPPRMLTSAEIEHLCAGLGP